MSNTEDNTEDRSEIDALYDRYFERMHAVQSGVAMMMHYNPAETEPKQLRTGINSAMVGNGALVKLFIDKGLITELEWATALLAETEREVARYEKMIHEHSGARPDQTITLG